MGMEKRSNQRSDARFSVVIVDDHPMVRDGLAVMLEARRLARVVAKTSGVDETVRAVHKLGVPDMVLSDIRMPNGDGFELLKKLRTFWPNIRVLLLAGMPLKEEEARAREGGAAGYLPKSCDIDILADAIKSAVADAKTFICESFSPPPSILSPREMDVLKYVAEGKQRDEIAIILGISPETVKSRMKSLMAKLDTTNAPGAVHRAHELGILQA